MFPPLLLCSCLIGGRGGFLTPQEVKHIEKRTIRHKKLPGFFIAATFNSFSRLKSSDMMPHVEKRLRNLSILVSDYQTHAMDLVRFACIDPAKDVSDEILKRTFIHVFKALKGGKNFLPIHLFIYSKIVDAVKKAKETPKKYALGVKDLKTDVNIENYNPADLKEPELFKVLNKISPEDRILLCLSIRHKVNNEELATLFRTSKGTIITRTVKAKAALAKALIDSNDISSKKQFKGIDSKTCFFTKSNISEKSKIEKHIAKCEPCRNFYNWQIKIDKLFDEEPKPTLSSSINRDIFKHLSLTSIDRRFLYNVRTKWKARTAFIVIILGLVALMLLWIKNNRHSQRNTIQEIKISSVVVQKPTEIKYYLSTTALKNWKDVNKNLKDIIKAYGEGVDAANEQGALYTIILDKENALKLVQEIQAASNFEVKTLPETQPLKDPKLVRVEIQVNKNGI